ncbi:MAG: hypothetical protein JRC66_06570 [Deltaproteobacteria bacterium]|nr:hypothetical protein [Deltaproteobacteria bacterium]
MEKSRLDNLLKQASKEEQLQLKIYYNASIKTLTAYQAESTTSKLRDLQSAETALEEYAGRLEERYLPDTRTFPNRLAVTKWLKDNGWKVSKSTVYNRIGKAKLLSREDGLFHLKDVKKYARVFLKRRDTGKRVQDEQDDLQRRKTRLEVEKLEISNARDRRKQEVEEGEYIPRDQLEIELASRAAVLDAGIAHFFQSNAGAWIDIVSGDQRKLSELIGMLMAAKDDFMNQYARAKEFVVEMGEQSEG